MIYNPVWIKTAQAKEVVAHEVNNVPLAEVCYTDENCEIESTVKFTNGLTLKNGRSCFDFFHNLHLFYFVKKQVSFSVNDIILL